MSGNKRCVERIFFLFIILCALGHAVSKNTERIIGGTAVSSGQFPYQVSVQSTTLCSYHGHVCGGALISDTHVVTAASCVTDKPGNSTWTAVRPAWYRVHVGNPDLDNTEAAFGVSKITVHPDFNPDTLAYDLAVLQLSEAVGEHGVPAQLAESAPIAGSSCNATGWGTASAEGLPFERYLLVAEVQRLSDDTCPNTSVSIADGMFCAGTPVTDVCLGDTGAPLACGGELAGLAVAPGCGEASFFTDLTKQRAWITSVLSSAAAPTPALLTFIAAAAALSARRLQSL